MGWLVSRVCRGTFGLVGGLDVWEWLTGKI